MDRVVFGPPQPPHVMRKLFADRDAFALAYLVLTPLYLAPLFATRFLPSFDLPHQLAIADALAKAARPDSPYARDFVVGLHFTPFAVHFVLLRSLAVFVSLNTAVKILVAIVVLALPLATARLLDVCGRDRMPAVFAFPLVYSLPLHHGFIAFVLALPLMIWMLAEAANEDGWSARPLRSALVLAAVSVLTFFTHLEAWAIAVVAAAAALLLGSTSWRVRGWGFAALMPSVLACLLYVAWFGRDPQLGAAPPFVRDVFTARARELAEYGVLADVWGRIRVAPIHLLRGFTDGSDLIASRIFFALIAAGVLIRLANWIRQSPRQLRRPGPSAGLVAAGLAAYFGLPHHAPPQALTVYPRFAVVAALLLLLAMMPASASSWPARVRQGLAACVAALLLAHSLSVSRHYAAFGRELADFEQLLDATPAALHSGGLVFDADSTVMDVGGIFTGVPAYYVTERPAPQSSTWLYYCAWPQLPCHLRHPNDVPLPFFSNPSEFNAGRALADLDLVFVRGGPPADRLFGPDLARVRLLATRGSWRAFARR